jgi:hypothetical protein
MTVVTHIARTVVTHTVRRRDAHRKTVVTHTSIWTMYLDHMDQQLAAPWLWISVQRLRAGSSLEDQVEHAAPGVSSPPKGESLTPWPRPVAAARLWPACTKALAAPGLAKTGGDLASSARYRQARQEDQERFFLLFRKCRVGSCPEKPPRPFTRSIADDSGAGPTGPGSRGRLAVPAARRPSVWRLRRHTSRLGCAAWVSGPWCCCDSCCGC